MNISVLIQLAINGLSMAMVYVLLASGLNLILSVPKILYVAYGVFYMLGAYITWGLMVLWGLPFLLALLVAILITAILGALIYRVVFFYIQDQEHQFLTNIVAATGLAMIMGQGALLIFGTSPRGIPQIFTGMVVAGPLRLSVQRLALIFLTLLVLIALHFFLQYTKIGRAMRATGFNADVAALQGVNTKRVYMATMAAGCGLAGFAGGVMAPEFAVSTEMANITLYVLLVVMLGGIGSMTGAILAGLIVGLTISYGQYYIGTGVAQIVLFIVIGLIIMFRPGGLRGQNEDIPF